MVYYMARVAALGTVLLSATAVTATADIKDYAFQLVAAEFKQGDAEVAVKLVHIPSGHVVPDAVIFAQRIDMGPDGMEMMQSSIEAMATKEPGIYRFKINLTMIGHWALSLRAKIQGETGTLESKLVLKAVK